MGLHAKLIRKSTGKVADASLSIARNIRDFPDVIEHMAAGEEQDNDQADGSPEVAILDNRQDIRPGDPEKAEAAQCNGCEDRETNVVDGPDDGRLGPCW